MLFISAARLYATLCSWGILYINNNYSNTEWHSVLGDPYSAFSGRQIVVRMETPIRKHLSKWWKMLYSGSKFKTGGWGSRRPYWGEMGSFSLSHCIFINSTCLCNDKQPDINNWMEKITSYWNRDAILKLYMKFPIITGNDLSYTYKTFILK